MKIKPNSTVYHILNDTRRLRLISKTNKHCSFCLGLLIDREIYKVFKPITRKRAGY